VIARTDYDNRNDPGPDEEGQQQGTGQKRLHVRPTRRSVLGRLFSTRATGIRVGRLRTDYGRLRGAGSRKKTPRLPRPPHIIEAPRPDGS
jgi:hypothetical protein